VISPATTTASTPDTPNRSANRYVTVGAMSVTAISSTGSPVRRSSAVMTSPINTPTSTPPAPITRKSTEVATGEKAMVPSATAAAAR
jgi:hypothetical protein